jgi:alpha-tubulin suppressor-like RCC1 family protein
MRWIAFSAVLAAGCTMLNPDWDEESAVDTEGATDTLGTDTSLSTTGTTSTTTDASTTASTATTGDPPPPASEPEICSGYEHSCLLQKNGDLYCWGSNRFGQIGDGTTYTAHAPVRVTLEGPAVDIACGSQTTCAVLEDGSAWCWGLNDDGILGYTGERENHKPSRVPGAPALSSVTLGNYHACATASDDGRIVCWGDNYRGQSGTDVPGAQFFGELTGVLAVEAGDMHNCLLAEDRTVQCWGEQSYSKTGAPVDDTIDFVATPIDVGLTDVVAIDGGENHSCALKDDGTLWCWGYNGYGQLGPGVEDNETAVPVQFAGLTGVVAFSAGANHTCASLDDGVTHCHGTSSWGVLGHTAPLVFANVTKLAAGQNHTCAIDDMDQVWCFGGDYAGQLGLGARWSTPNPVELELANVTQVDTHYDFSCAVTTANDLRCWGENSNYQLGDGTTNDRATPVNAAPTLDGTVTSVSVGENHSCVIDDSNQTWCWGHGDYGQLGDGLGEDSSAPVTALSGAVQLASGNLHTCAIDVDQNVWCWGLGTSGQLGDDLGTNSNVPIQVAGLSGVSDIQAGSHHTCALVSGQIWCWGDNGSGQLGDGTRSDAWVPIRPNDGNLTFVSMSLGEDTTCAVTDQAELWCWGNNYEYQMGNEDLVAPHNPEKAVTLAAPSNIVSVGYDHACVIQGGILSCSGSNVFGQLGDGTYARRGSFTAVKNNIVDVTAGATHTCALDNAGALFCFGNSYSGYVGAGTIARDTDVPTVVTFPE